MQVQSPFVLLSSLAAGDTAVMEFPTAGQGTIVLVASNYPALPTDSIAVVYLETGFLELQPVDAKVSKMAYKAVPA